MILENPIIGVRSVKNQQPSVEFMKNTSKVGGTSTKSVTKKFLEDKFQLVHEFVNKVVMPW